MGEDFLNKLIDLSKQFNVTKLIQFGSSLESFDDCKDMDFACDGLFDVDFFRFGTNLEILFNKSIDLVPLDPNDKFSDYIIKHGRLIYESSTN